MTTRDVGSRIAAVRDATDDTVYLFGRGVYAGDFPRPGSGNWSKETIAMATSVVTAGEAKNHDEVRAADDAFMERRLDKAVEEGKQTQQEANKNLAEYRRLRAEREARRAAMSVEEKVTELLTQMDLNPRLDLDGGGTVWGCECWWMPEVKFDEFRGSRRVVEVPEPVRESA